MAAASQMPEYSSSQAREWAEEHHRFLKESNPAFLANLVQSNSLSSHLHSVGEQAEEMHAGAMAMHNRKVQNLPHHQRVKELEILHQSMNEVVRHNLIYSPIPDENHQD